MHRQHASVARFNNHFLLSIAIKGVTDWQFVSFVQPNFLFEMGLT